MVGRRILEFPVYSCSEEQYGEAREQYLREHWLQWQEASRDISQTAEQDFETWRRARGALFRWEPWRFNKIVAFLEVFLDSKHVKIDACIRLDRRGRYAKTMPFGRSGRVAEAYIRDKTREDTRESVLRAISYAETEIKKKPTRKRWWVEYDRRLLESIDYEKWLSIE